MRKGMGKLAAVVALFVFSLGCMSAPLTIEGPTVPVTANDSYTEIGEASGHAWAGVLLGIIPIAESTPAKKALGRALQSSGGDGLINVAADTLLVNLGFVTLMRTTVSGTAIKVERGAAVR